MARQIVAAAAKSGAKLTYRPLDDGDPHTVVWNGHTFKANVPRDVANEDMIALARGNPHFAVDGVSCRRATPDREPVPMAGAESAGDVDPATLADDRKMIEADEVED